MGHMSSHIRTYTTQARGALATSASPVNPLSHATESQWGGGLRVCVVFCGDPHGLKDEVAGFEGKEKASKRKPRCGNPLQDSRKWGAEADV